MLFSPAGRDDADDLFAMVVLSIRVHHYQNGGIGRNLNYPNCMPPLLSKFVSNVRGYKTIPILERQCRKLK